jgi:hypothetical protein
MGRCDAYFEGDQMLAYATAAWREAFGSLFRMAPADNWMPLVVESKVERMEVQGFRFGKQQSADDAAWDIWQANGLDAESDMAHTEAVKLGEAYWLVEPPAPGDDPPRITLEVPHEFIVAHAPGDRRTRVAALKKWVDDDGYVYATLYLPDFIYKYRSQNKARRPQGRVAAAPGDEGGVNPLGDRARRAAAERPTPTGGGVSDLKVAMPIQDVINKLLIDMLLTSEYLAFPQRVLLGIEVPKDPVTGQPIRATQLEAARSRLWAFEARPERQPGRRVHRRGPQELRRGAQHLIHGLAAKTRTPPHYILGEMVNVSGDALTAAEAGLTSKTRRALKSVGEGHEETIRLAFLAIGDKAEGRELTAETIWRDPERLSLAQIADAAVKKKDVGVPWAQLMEDLRLLAGPDRPDARDEGRRRHLRPARAARADERPGRRDDERRLPDADRPDSRRRRTVIKIPPGTRAILARRGNMEVVLPIAPGVFTDAPAAVVATTLAASLIRQQLASNGRATEPIRLDETQLALRVIGRDGALDPDLPLSIQTEGLWEIRELPTQAQSDVTARLPVCTFELIDVERPSRFSPMPGSPRSLRSPTPTASA